MISFVGTRAHAFSRLRRHGPRPLVVILTIRLEGRDVVNELAIEVLRQFHLVQVQHSPICERASTNRASENHESSRLIAFTRRVDCVDIWLAH